MRKTNWYRFKPNIKNTEYPALLLIILVASEYVAVIVAVYLKKNVLEIYKIILEKYLKRYVDLNKATSSFFIITGNIIFNSIIFPKHVNTEGSTSGIPIRPKILFETI